MAFRRIRSLRHRTAAEVLGRARQALTSALERRGIGDLSEPVGDGLSALVDLTSFDERPVIRGPFFASLDDRTATLDALYRVDGQFAEKLRARADQVVAGRFDLLGFHGLSFGQPPDWWLDPVAGVRAPSLHWSRIDFLDPAVIGDHKVTWELSRHQGLVTLAQAWWCTGEEGYRTALETMLASWLDANRPKVGPHWASSLELAFRGIAWLWILALAGDALPPALRRRMVGFLALSARHIERYLSTWFSPNTHLTGEGLGLFMLGTALPQCRDAARWRSTGARILLDWVDRHVRPDGTYVEQSTWYHRYTTDFYLHFLALADRSGMSVRDRVAAPLGGLLDCLRWIARPDGTMPLIGDDDGGRLLFLDERTAHDVRTPLAIGAVLLGRGELATAAGRPTAELVWLLGPGAVTRFSGLPVEHPVSRHAAFTSGGLYVLRTGWDESASVMTIDAGPHGFLTGGHAHADALSIDLCLDGHPVFVDPGTFTYTTSPAWRDHFRQTASHCAAVVDGCGSAVTSGPFQWASRAEARSLAWHDGGAVALLAGTHDGFSRLRPPVRYRRIVAFVEPDLWIVRDELDADDEHELAVHWQCAPGIESVVDGDRVLVRKGSVLLAEMRVAEAGGEWSVTEGWVSSTYGARATAAHLRHVRRGVGALVVTTVLCTSQAPAVAVGDAPGRVRPVEVRWGARHGMLVTRAGMPPWLDTDAEVAWVEYPVDGSPINVTATGAAAVVRPAHAGPTPGYHLKRPGRPAVDPATDPT